MKKEIIAVVVLALMIAASIYNYHHLEDIKDDVIAASAL